MRARMPEQRQPPQGDPGESIDAAVARAVRALRAEVPVRAEWRAKVLQSAAGSPRAAERRRLVLSWPFAAAAGIALFVAGAALARLVELPGHAARTAAAAPARVLERAATRFVFVAPNARQVALVGDFNLWDPSRAPMHRIAGTDAWEIDLTLPPGRHGYAFVVDGDVTADPSAPRTAGDDFGRPSSVVLVSSNRS
jgi:Glycogen recognition site of AMP-activated protein kinase